MNYVFKFQILCFKPDVQLFYINLHIQLVLNSNTEYEIPLNITLDFITIPAYRIFYSKNQKYGTFMTE